MRRRAIFSIVVMAFVITASNSFTRQLKNQAQPRQKSEQPAGKGPHRQQSAPRTAKQPRNDMLLGAWEAKLQLNWANGGFRLFLDKAIDPLSGYIVGDGEPCHLREITSSGNKFRGIVNAKECKLLLTNLQDKQVPIEFSDGEKNVITGTVLGNKLVGKYESNGETYQWEAERIRIGSPDIAKEAIVPTIKSAEMISASVKTKNGKTVNGQIKGQIVLSMQGQKLNQCGSMYLVVCYIINGKSVTLIDELGTHLVDDSVGLTYYIFMNSKQEPSENAVREFIGNLKLLEPYIKRIANNDLKFYHNCEDTVYLQAGRLDTKLIKKAPVIGEFGENAVAPTIKIRTSKGEVSLSTREIVEQTK
ncbi:MAG: hypothetical protein MOB07_11805 [Acidobacteria bacterium]|nr:hypothetical protein [Acidobacteriota bacterium]